MYNKHEQTNIHAVSETRIRDPSNRAASVLRLGPHGNRDGQWIILIEDKLAGSYVHKREGRSA